MKQQIINDWWKNKRSEVKKKIFSEFNQKTTMKTTDLEKVVVYSGVGRSGDEQSLEKTKKTLSCLAQGQKPAFTKVKHSIASLKIRSGMPLGFKVTLRKKRAWDFLFELINVALPQINNFGGFKESKIDKQGKNYSIGLNDLNIFPSVDFTQTFKGQGVQINFVFKNSSSKENKRFLQLLNFPLILDSHKNSISKGK